ncbi:VOC family protein [Natrialbaceae archaeon A-arb3/5]
MDVIHTAIWVSNLEDAREFFVEGLGLEETRSFTFDGTENVYVGGEHGEIQLRYDPDRDAPDPDRAAFDHVAVSVEDVDAEAERVVEATGCEIVEGPITVETAGARVAFLDGPEGYVVELVEDL